MIGSPCEFVGQDAVGHQGRSRSHSAVSMLVAKFPAFGIVSHGDIGGLGKGPLEIVIALFAS